MIKTNYSPPYLTGRVVFGVPLNNGAPPLNATAVGDPGRKRGAWLRGLDKRDSVLIRIWVHRRHPLAGTAAGWRSFPIRHVRHAGAGRR